MGLQERLDALQPRERRLLAIFAGLFVLIAVVLIPVGVSATLADERAENQMLREAIERLFVERDKILERRSQNQRVVDRYRVPAPRLAGFLDNQAKTLGLEIPEFKDRPVVPIGKTYEEHATDISLKQASMRNIVLFMEKIAQAPFPTSLTRLTIRKRATQSDSWDVTMTVSTFHRTAPATKAAGSGEASATDGAQREDTP